MPIARWKDLCIDATDAHGSARFWGAVLGLAVELHDDGDAALRGATPEETIWINTVPEPRTVKQRVHLDLDVASVDAVLALGATMLLPATESGHRWSVLADPEGGELCTFERDGMPATPPARLYELIVDTIDTDAAHAQAEWWAGVWGGSVVDDDRGFSWVEGIPGTPFATIDFGPVPEPKTVKNRMHICLRPTDRTRDEEVDRILGLGATLVDDLRKGPDRGWAVLADPEGNEFCVLTQYQPGA
jgi:hypothetical protein